MQRGALVHGDVVGLIAFDLVLQIVRAAVAGMALPLEVALMDLRDRAAHAASFGAPADVSPILNLWGTVASLISSGCGALEARNRASQCAVRLFQIVISLQA